RDNAAAARRTAGRACPGAAGRAVPGAGGLGRAGGVLLGAMPGVDAGRPPARGPLHRPDQLALMRPSSVLTRRGATTEWTLAAPQAIRCKVSPLPGRTAPKGRVPGEEGSLGLGCVVVSMATVDIGSSGVWGVRSVAHAPTRSI